MIENMPVDQAKLSRLRWMLSRIEAGVNQQHKRLNEREANAPRIDLGPGTPPIINFVGMPANDVDYYVFEISRLRDLAEKAEKLLKAPPSLVSAIEDFDEALPLRRTYRNALTHPDTHRRLDTIGFFNDLVELNGNGSVTKIVDPLSDHQHGAVLQLVITTRTELDKHVAPA